MVYEATFSLSLFKTSTSAIMFLHVSNAEEIPPPQKCYTHLTLVSANAHLHSATAQAYYRAFRRGEILATNRPRQPPHFLCLLALPAL